MKRRAFPKPQLAVASVLGLLVALAGGYFFLIKPQRDDAARLGASIADAQAQIQAAQAPPSANPDVAPIRVMPEAQAEMGPAPLYPAQPTVGPICRTSILR